MVCGVAFVPLLTVHMNRGCTGMSSLMNANCLRFVVKKQASVVAQKKTMEIGNEEIRRQTMREMRKMTSD